MSQFNDAAAAIRRAAKQFEQFSVAADILDKIGNLDNAEKEAKAAVSKAVKERDDALAALSDAKSEVSDAKKKADEVQSNAESKADEIVDTANKSADAIISLAKDKANEIIANAETTATKSVSLILSRIEDLESKKNDLENQISVLSEQANAAYTSAIDAEARLAKVNAAIAKLAGGA